MKAYTSEAELAEARFLKEEPRLIVQVVQELNEGLFGGHRCRCMAIPTASARPEIVDAAPVRFKVVTVATSQRPY
jgi:hypothetical protein